MSELSAYDLNSYDTWQERLDEMPSTLDLPADLLDYIFRKRY